MSVTFFIQAVVARILGLLVVCLISLKLLFSFIISPFQFTRKTFFIKRDVMPSCLNEPSLGTHEFLKLQDIKLHYVISGDEGKPLMVCLHGFPEFWYSWRYQIPEFNKDYRVVALDQRGYGDSEKPSGKDNYYVAKLSADVAQLIETLGYSKCTLLGHDWGGAVAWNFSYHYPHMVEKLVVMNSPHPGTFAKYLSTHFSQFKKSWYMYMFQWPLIPELLMGSNDMEAFNMMMKSLKNNKACEEDVEAYKYAFGSVGGFKGPINWYRAAFSRPVKYPKKKVDMPTLVIWGEPDQALDTQLAYLAGEYMSNLTVEVVKDSCHFVMMDKPDVCNKLIRKFLKED